MAEVDLVVGVLRQKLVADIQKSLVHHVYIRVVWIRLEFACKSSGDVNVMRVKLISLVLVQSTHTQNIYHFHLKLDIFQIKLSTLSKTSKRRVQFSLEVSDLARKWYIQMKRRTS